MKVEKEVYVVIRNSDNHVFRRGARFSKFADINDKSVRTAPFIFKTEKMALSTAKQCGYEDCCSAIKAKLIFEF